MRYRLCYLKGIVWALELATQIKNLGVGVGRKFVYLFAIGNQTFGPICTKFCAWAITSQIVAALFPKEESGNIITSPSGLNTPFEWNNGQIHLGEKKSHFIPCWDFSLWVLGPNAFCPVWLLGARNECSEIIFIWKVYLDSYDFMLGFEVRIYIIFHLFQRYYIRDVVLNITWNTAVDMI